MTTRDGATNAAEVHVHIGRLVIDASSAGDADAQRFEAALQAALAQRLGTATPTHANPPQRGFNAPHAVADAVAARIRPHLAPEAKG